MFLTLELGAHYSKHIRRAHFEPRSFGKEQIQGDNHAHYGLAGRLAWIQLQAHHWNDLLLQQQEKGK